jgi:hypothetical protein
MSSVLDRILSLCLIITKQSYWQPLKCYDKPEQLMYKEILKLLFLGVLYVFMYQNVKRLYLNIIYKYWMCCSLWLHRL